MTFSEFSSIINTITKHTKRGDKSTMGNAKKIGRLDEDILLRDYIKRHPGRHVKIGTYSGGGFIYEGYIDNAMKKQLARLNAYYQSQYSKVVDNYDRKLDTYQVKNGNKQQQAVLERTKQRRAAASKRATHFIKFQSRQVIQVYKSTVHSDLYIVIIDGKENGSDLVDLPGSFEPENLDLSACLSLLETLFQDAAQNYADAYRYYLRKPRDNSSKQALHSAGSFFRNSPLVHWSGVDGEEAMRGIEFHVRNSPRLQHELKMRDAVATFKEGQMEERRARRQRLADRKMMHKQQHLERKQKALEAAEAGEAKQTTMMTPAEAIIRKLHEDNITIVALSKECGVSKSLISKWKTGGYPKSFSPKIQIFAEYLGVYDEIKAYYDYLKQEGVGGPDRR